MADASMGRVISRQPKKKQQEPCKTCLNQLLLCHLQQASGFLAVDTRRAHHKVQEGADVAPRAEVGGGKQVKFFMARRKGCIAARYKEEARNCVGQQ